MERDDLEAASRVIAASTLDGGNFFPLPEEEQFQSAFARHEAARSGGKPVGARLGLCSPRVPRLHNRGALVRRLGAEARARQSREGMSRLGDLVGFLSTGRGAFSGGALERRRGDGPGPRVGPPDGPAEGRPQDAQSIRLSTTEAVV